MDKILEVKNINISFKLEDETAKAIHGVSLTVEKAKALGVVGESGCGKSVTAMSIMRLLPKNAIVESGEIIYKGQNLLDVPDDKMREYRGANITLIPQDPLTSLNPLYTIGDQILEAVLLHQDVSKKQGKQIVIDALKAVKIPEPEERYKDYPHQFSGGMRQRVIIAMALSCNPELIIADEPTTALDVTVQAQILKLIEDIKKERHTSMILITHDLGVIAEVCDDVAVMYAGRIVEYTTVNKIFDNPLHPYTKGLIASLPNIKGEKLKPIKGAPPSITDRVTGCPFHLRCPYKIEGKCENEEPALLEVEPEHKVACWLY